METREALIQRIMHNVTQITDSTHKIIKSTRAMHWRAAKCIDIGGGILIYYMNNY